MGTFDRIGGFELLGDVYLMEEHIMLRPACSIFALLLSALPAFSDASLGEHPITPQRCQALPGDGHKSDETAGRSPSKTLEDCHGVLKPPDIGDSDMAEPAPDVGETPVLRPGELPRQQNPK